MGDVRGRAVVLVVQVGGEGGDADPDETLVPVRYPGQPELPADCPVLVPALPPTLVTAPDCHQAARTLLQPRTCTARREAARGPADPREQEHLLLPQLQRPGQDDGARLDGVHTEHVPLLSGLPGVSTEEVVKPPGPSGTGQIVADGFVLLPVELLTSRAAVEC